MTSGKVVGQIIEPIPQSGALSEFCDDAQSEWVAADTGQMLTQEVGRSAEVAGGRCADHFDVMAFPVHLSASGFLGRRPLDRAEIHDCEPEGRIGGHREFQRPSGSAAVDGTLGLPVPRCRPVVGRDRAPVLLDGRHSVGQLTRILRFLTSGVFHGSHGVPMV
jgi:hypothetical protein